MIDYTLRALPLHSEMAELEAAKLELAKQDRAAANGLLDAVAEQDVPRVTHLLAIGVNPNAVIDIAHPCGGEGYPDGTSALTIALAGGNVPIARLLLAAGASTELAEVKRKMKPLMYVAVTNQLEGVKLLVEFCVKLNAVSKVGKTALILAAQEGYGEVVQFLIDSGADLNVQDGAGMSALHWAAQEGQVEATRILLIADAELDLESKLGKTAAKVALLNQHVAVLELLLRFGASAHRAAVLPEMESTDTAEVTESDHRHWYRIINALSEQPSVVHLLADHGGICEKEVLDYQLSGRGRTQVLCAMRRVGCDAWWSVHYSKQLRQWQWRKTSLAWCRCITQ